VAAEAQADHADVRAASRPQVVEGGSHVAEHLGAAHRVKQLEAALTAGAVVRELDPGRGPVVEIRGEGDQPKPGQPLAHVADVGTDAEELHRHQHAGEGFGARGTGDVGAHRRSVIRALLVLVMKVPR